MPYDDSDGQFSSGVHRHPDFGLLDQQHLPLSVLQQYFPSEFERLRRYRSFALLRNPYDRFPSSIAQRLTERGISFHTLSRLELAREVEVAISYLSQHDVITNPAYIHLARQSHYLEVGNEHVVKHHYAVGNVDIMLRDISELIDADLVLRDLGSTANKTNVYRHESLRKTFETCRPIVGGALLTLLPEPVKKRIRRLLYLPIKQNMPEIFNSDTVKGFISDYYRRDFEVYERTKGYENTE